MFCEYMLTIKLTCYCFVGDSNRIISHASINIYKSIIAHIVKVMPFKKYSSRYKSPIFIFIICGKIYSLCQNNGISKKNVSKLSF